MIGWPPQGEANQYLYNGITDPFHSNQFLSNFADMSIQDYNIQPVADGGNPGVVVGASEGSGAPRKVFLYEDEQRCQ